MAVLQTSNCKHLTGHDPLIRSDEGLCSKLPASQFPTVANLFYKPLIKQSLHFTTPLKLHHSFFRNLTPLFIFNFIVNKRHIAD